MTKLSSFFPTVLIALVLLLAACRGAAHKAGADAGELLTREVQAANAQLPAEAGHGLTLVLLAEEEACLVCQLSVDEDAVSLKELALQAARIKKGIIESLNALTDREKMLLEYAMLSGKDLAYRYVGNHSGDSFDIVIDRLELAEIVD